MKKEDRKSTSGGADTIAQLLVERINEAASKWQDETSQEKQLQAISRFLYCLRLTLSNQEEMVLSEASLNLLKLLEKNFGDLGSGGYSGLFKVAPRNGLSDQEWRNRAHLQIGYDLLVRSGSTPKAAFDSILDHAKKNNALPDGQRNTSHHKALREALAYFRSRTKRGPHEQARRWHKYLEAVLRELQDAGNWTDQELTEYFLINMLPALTKGESLGACLPEDYLTWPKQPNLTRACEAFDDYAPNVQWHSRIRSSR
jgi:hypothetical protein